LAASAGSTMVIVGGARAITNGSAIDEPRPRPFRGRGQPRNAPLNAVLSSLEKLNAQRVDFVAHCVSCYALDECGARNRASRSTKHFQDSHGTIRHRDGSSALLLARWPTAVCFGFVPQTPRVWFSTRLSHRLKPLVGGDGSGRHGRSALIGACQERPIACVSD